jgi:hypothetical protein
MKQLASACMQFVKPEQAMRTHLDIGLVIEDLL